MSASHRRKRTNQILRWSVAGALVGSILLAASPAAGATGSTAPPDVNSGKQGVHILVDLPSAPGARCVYRSDFHLHHIVVQPPIVFGYDRTAGKDLQKVTWRYEIWTAPALNGTWTMQGAGTWQARHASDLSNAPFVAEAFSVPSGLEQQLFFVRARVRWYGLNGTTIEGVSAMGVHEYLNHTPFSDYVTAGDCLGQFT